MEVEAFRLHIRFAHMSDPVSTPPPAGDKPVAPAPAAAAPAPAVAKPAMPAKPAPAPAAGSQEDRRFFLLRWLSAPLTLAWVAFSAAVGGMILGLTRFLFPNVLSEPPNKVKIGDPRNYEDGKVVETYKDRGIWVVRYKGKIFALSTTCTHLGCTPNWQEADKKFKCPCHGSGFYMDGINFEGPAPRPLERWAIGIGDDGQLVVDKGRKFQEELGQWDSPDSFVKV